MIDLKWPTQFVDQWIFRYSALFNRDTRVSQRRYFAAIIRPFLTFPFFISLLFFLPSAKVRLKCMTVSRDCGEYKRGEQICKKHVAVGAFFFKPLRAGDSN